MAAAAAEKACGNSSSRSAMVGQKGEVEGESKEAGFLAVVQGWEKLRKGEVEVHSKGAWGLLAVVQGWEKFQKGVEEWPAVDRLVAMLQVGGWKGKWVGDRKGWGEGWVGRGKRQGWAGSGKQGQGKQGWERAGMGTRVGEVSEMCGGVAGCGQAGCHVAGRGGERKGIGTWERKGWGEGEWN